MIAKADEDTMYWDKAMKQPDKENFLQAAFNEIKTHEENQHWEVVPIEHLPKETPVLDAIWNMKRKRRLKTNKVYKHKARLNIHGGQQELGVNYWETHAPVVTWAVIRLFLVLALMHGWTTISNRFHPGISSSTSGMRIVYENTEGIQDPKLRSEHAFPENFTKSLRAKASRTSVEQTLAQPTYRIRLGPKHIR
jgi:Reverse transcriptase (RNA-dependent DNA polymerase)